MSAKTFTSARRSSSGPAALKGSALPEPPFVERSPCNVQETPTRHSSSSPQHHPQSPATAQSAADSSLLRRQRPRGPHS